MEMMPLFSAARIQFLLYRIKLHDEKYLPHFRNHVFKVVGIWKYLPIEKLLALGLIKNVMSRTVMRYTDGETCDYQQCELNLVAY
jgi:hypothetical protein